ncbi:uncharacterized protein N7515_002257 [Penicillium bovifimosum]|uniref:Uncharacterized protein n=1 Tax=Penicillium bovifimosum TaxID=126998 RepID=A0A9W9HBV4_9EURO|nr:uncharacterized protein N7515_002257 [Penicillium bovifimosum]KAJ5143470.1 hypothetical protein N7515_002257 [Penicillium bovifimosum]
MSRQDPATMRMTKHRYPDCILNGPVWVRPLTLRLSYCNSIPPRPAAEIQSGLPYTITRTPSTKIASTCAQNWRYLGDLSSQMK